MGAAAGVSRPVYGRWRVRSPPAPFAPTVANGLRDTDPAWNGLVRLATCMMVLICRLSVGERVRRAQLPEIRRTGTARASAAGPGGVFSRMPEPGAAALPFLARQTGVSSEPRRPRNVVSSECREATRLMLTLWKRGTFDAI